MTRDALRVVMVNGLPTFPDAPMLPGGAIDWARLGGVPEQYRHEGPDGRRHPIRTRGSVPHPTTGLPVTPE